ncbi:hypothetical protein LSTR_LSTR004876 [Laodelphax striatellus]|uniref:Translation initiation factor eIF2B subunit delta n=1 Tax=Laodelphax striatellus TaxID=195883 RepID=A0A482XN49_LAOST|nr:hypothetical protein LSTR_LSTR004876 [Laodelphax striatellus]
MNIENKSNDSAKAQQTSKSCDSLLSESKDSDPTDSKQLSKAKKRRLRLRKKNLNPPSVSDKACVELGSANPAANGSSSEINPISSENKKVEKPVPEINKPAKRIYNGPLAGGKSNPFRFTDKILSSGLMRRSESRNCQNQTEAVLKSNDSKQKNKSNDNRGSDGPSSSTRVRKYPINSEPSIDKKNSSLEGSSAIAERLAIVEKLFDSPAFSHIVDRIQVETDSRQGRSSLSGSPAIDKIQVETSTRQERSSLGESPANDRKPLVSSESEDSQQKQKPINMNNKSREEVMAEREAKKAAKAAAKAAKSKPKSAEGTVPVDGPNKPNQCANDAAKDTKKPVSQIESTATLEATKAQVQKETTAPSNRVSDVVDGTTLHLKRNLAQLIDNQIPETKKDASLKIEEVKKSEPATEKSKAELKAERRAKQEAQRAAKAAAKAADHGQVAEKQDKPIVRDTIKEKVVRAQESNVPSSEGQYMIKLFSHLRLNKDRLKEDYENLHPAIIKLGIQYESRIVCGSNARCVALLYAFKKMLSDYSTPSKQEFSRGLESVVARSMAYIDQCRPASVSMVNAVRHIKRHLTQIPNTLSDLQAKQKLYDVIDTYVKEQIDVAGEAISNTVQKKITNGDVILTYGCSSLVRRILTESHKSGTKFSVIVADGAPWFEGREMLKRLVKEGLNCSYVPISATSFVMREASKVVVGAHALLANGCVVSRAGTSQLALLARSYNVAVLVCCETHKFSERVQTDAFVYNELGGDEREQKEKRLSLAYDLTPPDLVTAVVTEVGILPCTSVPVILRIKPSESVV